MYDWRLGSIAWDHNGLRPAVGHLPREGIKAKTTHWMLFSRHFNVHFHNSLSYQHFSKPIKPKSDGVNVLFKLQLCTTVGIYHNERWQHDFPSLFDPFFFPNFVSLSAVFSTLDPSWILVTNKIDDSFKDPPIFMHCPRSGKWKTILEIIPAQGFQQCLEQWNHRLSLFLRNQAASKKILTINTSKHGG